MSDRFETRIVVRGYELDPQGHLNQAVYLQYAEHARWELFRACGLTQEDLAMLGVGPVVMENTTRYYRELRGGDTVDVSCEIDWGSGKSFKLRQRIVRDDGVLAAEVDSVAGLLDLAERRLLADPAGFLAAHAKDPTPAGLTPTGERAAGPENPSI